MRDMQVLNKSVWYNIKQAEMKERCIQEEEREEGISECSRPAKVKVNQAVLQ
jgi:hypothetical protein